MRAVRLLVWAGGGALLAAMLVGALHEEVLSTAKPGRITRWWG